MIVLTLAVVRYYLIIMVVVLAVSFGRHMIEYMFLVWVKVNAYSVLIQQAASDVIKYLNRIKLTEKMRNSREMPNFRECYTYVVPH